MEWFTQTIPFSFNNSMQILSQNHFAKSNCNYQVKNQDMYSYREFRHHFILLRLSHLLPNSRYSIRSPNFISNGQQPVEGR